MVKNVIRINQIKVKIDEKSQKPDREVLKKVNELARINALKNLLGPIKNIEDVSYKICKKSIDSRHKPDIYYVYSVNVTGIKSCNLNKIVKVLSENNSKNNIKLPKDVTVAVEYDYEFPVKNNHKTTKNIVVVGFGPAGMFAALKLVRAGFKPVVLERGECVEDRTSTVKHFWETGELNPESNVQFGEGGAGTFSDGKLNTMIKDSSGRIKEVLRELVEFGADPEILYLNKPHIGTDVLATVVKNIRQFILDNGGEIYFNTKVTDIEISNDGGKTAVKNVKTVNTKTGKEKMYPCDCLCLAIGHSSRDTFSMLYNKNCVPMEPKAFAVGLRIEHPQELINNNAYGDGCDYTNLPVADYKVTAQTSEGRGVYSFCMCPGGFVVNASSEQGMTAVNGMSYSKRDSVNANSALIVTVTPDDFGHNVLDGIEFQRNLEKNVYEIGKGKVVVQLLKDYKEGEVSCELGSVKPCIKGAYVFGDLNKVLPSYVNKAIIEGVGHFDTLIKGFDMPDAVLSGVESRTSSPVKILRDSETLQSLVYGIYPCGEGAGYAGGITSAAVDGIKVAEKIAYICEIL